MTLLDQPPIAVALGRLVSVHEHTWLYRVLALVIGFLLLSLCYPLVVVGEPAAGVISALLVLLVLGWFLRWQSTERLFLHENGLLLTRGSRARCIQWSEISKLNVQWAYTGEPPGFFEAELFNLQGERIVLRANWKNRESIDWLLLALANSGYPGESGIPR